MGLDKEIEKGIWGVEEETHKRTSVSSARFRLKKMRMEVDTLDYAIEEVLSMECEDTKVEASNISLKISK